MKFLVFPLLLFLFCDFINAQTYRMPGEDEPHEGTWLQWPHNDLYGPYYQADVEPGWVTMVSSLQNGEKVHIIAKNEAHKTHIIGLLNSASVPLTNVDFFLFPTDDVWARDNGPVFVYDQNDNLKILDWGFNGWGFDTPYLKCDIIPQSVSTSIGISRIDLNAMVLEGGSIEHDGNGTMVATRSCIVHSSRNPGLTEAQIENYLTQNMGISKFIWLDGVYGQDITDHHVDGFLKFGNDSTIVTMDSLDLDYWLLTGSEINTIFSATNSSNVPYNIVTLPLTQNNVVTATGFNLNIKGSYCNYYIANNVVLVPIYNDPNDAPAMAIIQNLYPGRTVVGINVQNLYEYGGMTHCVTQQQPIDLNLNGLNEENPGESIFVYPNPSNGIVHFLSDNLQVKVMDMHGKYVLFANHQIQLDLSTLPKGIYTIEITEETFSHTFFERIVLN
jgi:agmatine deiminase